MKALLVLLATLLPAATGAAGFQDLATLEKRVVAALDKEIGQPGGPVAPIDRRLKLAQCPTTVTIDPPALGAIALRCEPLGWRIRVPLVRAAAAASAEAPVRTVAASKPAALIKRGDPVSVVAEARGFSVSSEAVADEDGAAGARIRVKTDRAKAPIVVEVVDVGIVRIASIR